MRRLAVRLVAAGLGVAAAAVVAGCSPGMPVGSTQQALPGDGHWHPAAVAPAPSGAQFPAAMAMLPAAHNLLGVNPAAPGTFDSKSTEVSYGQRCDATMADFTTGLDKLGLMVLAKGTQDRSSWLTIADKDGTGVSLSLADSGTDCFVDELPLTPVSLKSTGSPEATGNTTAAVSCVIAPAGAGPSIIVTIFGASVQQSLLSIILVVPKITVGTYTVGDGLQGGVLTIPVRSYAELNATHPDVVASGFQTGGLMATGGRLTIAAGIAAGSFDVMYGSGELKGVFECGTPAFPATT